MPKILVIDDDSDYRKLFTTILTKAGYEIEEACNGKVGLNKFKQGSFDLIITDIFMPEEEGMAVIYKARRHNPNIKIIAVSGGGLSLGMKKDVFLNMALQMGANFIIEKPFDINNFLQTVSKILNSEE